MKQALKKKSDELTHKELQTWHSDMQFDKVYTTSIHEKINLLCHCITRKENSVEVEETRARKTRIQKALVSKMPSQWILYKPHGPIKKI